MKNQKIFNELKVIFVASELTPLAKVGGLGDVASALPKALKRIGVDVRIAIPKYEFIDEKKYSLEILVKDFPIKVGSGEEKINIFQTFLPGTNVPVYLLENFQYLSQDGVYFEKTAFCGSFREIERFLFFSKCLVLFPEIIGWKPNIFHLNDWHTAMVPLFLALEKKNFKTIFTIHNLANQGKWKAEKIFNFLGLKGDEHKNLKKRTKNSLGEEELNILEQGILAADLITTVSPTYAREILTKEYGEGLEKTLFSRKKDLFGILNGLDIEFFNPETDPFIPENYSLETLEKKVENKVSLQKEMNLEIAKDIPLLGLVSRLVPQKGIDLVIKLIPQLIDLGVELIILGSGLEEYENLLKEASLKYKRRVSVNFGFNAELAQKIYAGAEIFLMPSKFEPCGLGQLIAMRYGTIPIVRAVGGLRDTVKPEKKFFFWSKKGTGFVFKKYQEKAFYQKIKEAICLFKNKKKWREMQIRAMNQDFSWQESARKYLELYQILSNF